MSMSTGNASTNHEDNAVPRVDDWSGSAGRVKRLTPFVIPLLGLALYFTIVFGFSLAQLTSFVADDTVLLS